MKIEAVEKYLDVQERLLKEADYLKLREEYQVQNAAFSEVMAQLPPEQREVIEDYLGLCAEIHTRMLQIACEM